MRKPLPATFPANLFASLLVLLLFSLPGCLYADFTTTLDEDLNQTQLGSKQGEASSHAVLWSVAWGDSGSKAAAEAGGITTAQHADRRVFQVLWGLYTRVTTVVYGE